MIAGTAVAAWLAVSALVPDALPSGAGAAGPPRVRRRLVRVPAQRLVLPSDFAYLGAFRLPDHAEGAADQATFEYGGEGMTYRDGGDPAGPDDGFPGSLYITGFAVESWVAEVDIPAPAIVPRDQVDQLPVARLLQPFADVRGSLFATLTEIPRVGLTYLDAPQTGPRVHVAWGQHFQEDASARLPSHAAFECDLSNPRTAGAWWIGTQSLYSVNGYLLEIPSAWADAHVGGRRLGTGRFRDGGWSGRGPALFAYAPWLSGYPPPDGARLAEVPLLLYSNTRGEGSDPTESRLDGYQRPDEWEGAAWMTTPSGGTAVAFVGTKGVGAYQWYGWIDPAAPETPCVETEGTGMLGCWLADGSPCPAELIHECAGHTSDRGWWSSRFEARILLYDPADLAAVARGVLQPGGPQPYAWLSIDDRLALPDPCVEAMTTGTGAQRRMRVGEAAFDRQRGRLFVVERFADGAKPIVHVWGVR